MSWITPWWPVEANSGVLRTGVGYTVLLRITGRFFLRDGGTITGTHYAHYYIIGMYTCNI